MNKLFEKINSLNGKMSPVLFLHKKNFEFQCSFMWSVLLLTIGYIIALGICLFILAIYIDGYLMMFFDTSVFNFRQPTEVFTRLLNIQLGIGLGLVFWVYLLFKCKPIVKKLMNRYCSRV